MRYLSKRNQFGSATTLLHVAEIILLENKVKLPHQLYAAAATPRLPPLQLHHLLLFR